jgi:hypothetical protein
VRPPRAARRAARAKEPEKSTKVRGAITEARAAARAGAAGAVIGPRAPFLGGGGRARGLGRGAWRSNR